MREQPEILGMGRESFTVGFGQQRDTGGFLFHFSASEDLRVSGAGVGGAGTLGEEAEHLGGGGGDVGLAERAKGDAIGLGAGFDEIAKREGEQERRRGGFDQPCRAIEAAAGDRKSTRLNSS